MSRSNATRSETGGRASARPAPLAQLVAAVACDRPQAAPQRFSLASHSEVWLGRAPPEAGPDIFRLTFTDERMSALHARLRRVLGRWVLEDAGSKNGVRVHGTPQSRAVLETGDSFECGQTFFVYEEHPASPPVPALPANAEALGCQSFHPALLEAWSALARVAPTRVSVVLQGETGTGKELAARALHAWSGRSGPFVAVNCGALPEPLAESELFGVRRGAFTGATEDRPGLVRSSSGGTLLLDEVGELPASVQVKLLRVLQESEVQPVGSPQPVRVDLRVVAATHRDLEALVEEGSFRADLYARLTGLEVELPPLRERRADLGLLIPALLRRAGASSTLRLSREAVRALFRWRWPHNVRELERALALAVALAGTGRVELAHLPEPVRTAPEPVADPTSTPEPRPLSEAEVARRTQLIELLRAHQGNVSAVAREMGVARMQVQRWCRRFHVDPASFRVA